MFANVLVANRGEIARRVIRTLDRLGIGSVAVFTPADRDAPHVHEASEAVSVSSYLAIPELIAACTRTAAEALHPGYGFHSENPDLARACAQAGVVFVGPPPEVSELMGDKLRAKAAAEQAGVPVVPTFSEAEAAAPGTPYPLLVKAAAGGGGRGMRVVDRREDLQSALESARREAQAGFGDDRVFIERFLLRARHIEVQVLGDTHGNVLHLGERECSLQRRHQKVIEESPSPVVGPELRARLGAAAVALARAGGYIGAGTVEFITAFENPAEHYFLEMNARLQVEHPVTELVCGLDLVEAQLRVAAGEPLALDQSQVLLTGHAIEARINAEDATRDFLPAAGRVLAYHRPPGVRVDDAIEVGSVIDTSYDSLLAKVIVHGSDRQMALSELDRALAHTTVLGVTTTTGFLRSLIATDEVRTGQLDTGLVQRVNLPPGPPSETVARAAALISLRLLSERSGDEPFARADGWRLGGQRARSWWRLAVGGGDAVEVVLTGDEAVAVQPSAADAFTLIFGDERHEWTYAEDGDTLWVGCGGWAWPVRHRDADQSEAGQSGGDLRAPMPGQVLLVPASVGEEVHAGDTLVVLESMKMELAMTAPVDGTVAELSVAVGDKVGVDQPLARVEPNGSP
ncbi:MAG: acetyl-CoA/propionyl-CoA carboxylase, biotin carboxylase, biotin carboxyl carrier protein [Solirubrobacteraceae bacterium]|jgi:acetyl-CoA/propionyl-CoA carboxylase biotin carboxyl carrier protein|nr:acetyl-CoA/propionyl-CoA carboxylase, biotin carboxylase, biotin carboxyl carrier protein [Solirubrobacteraceae bacterium]